MWECVSPLDQHAWTLKLQNEKDFEILLNTVKNVYKVFQGISYSPNKWEGNN